MKSTKEEFIQKAEHIVRSVAYCEATKTEKFDAFSVAQALLEAYKREDNHDCWSEAVSFAQDQTRSPGPDMNELKKREEEVESVLKWIDGKRRPWPKDMEHKRKAVFLGNMPLALADTVKTLLQGKES